MLGSVIIAPTAISSKPRRQCDQVGCPTKTICVGLIERNQVYGNFHFLKFGSNDIFVRQILSKGVRQMTDGRSIVENLARLRLDRRLTQEVLAAKAGLSRVALGKIERGAVVPRARTLAKLSNALAVPVGELVTPVGALESVRFRTRARVHGREQILAIVSMWLDAYTRLEADLKQPRLFRFKVEHPSNHAIIPDETAQAARRATRLGPEEAVRDICGLLEENGVKLLLLETKRDSFFGLSVGAPDGGPAVIVNTWDRISVERWIFTAAHELGHLLLHPSEYRREATELPAQTEREADIFASEFLMPEEAFAPAWNRTRGHPLLVRVLKVKRIFRVSYKTVLYRLVKSGYRTPEVWRTFQRQHRHAFGKTLRKTDEPEALQKSEFAWNWSRSGEPAGLSQHDFVGDRLSRLVRRALEQQKISLGRAAEILGLSREDMREQARGWVGRSTVSGARSMRSDWRVEPEHQDRITCVDENRKPSSSGCAPPVRSGKQDRPLSVPFQGS